MRPGLLVKFHFGRLSDADLTDGVKCLMAGYDHAPAVSEFLIDAMQDEQTRRLKNHGGELHEAEAVVLKATEWSALDLVQGLNAMTALSYQACSEQFGKLIDTLVRTFGAALGARAIVLENMVNDNLARS